VENCFLSYGRTDGHDLTFQKRRLERTFLVKESCGKVLTFQGGEAGKDLSCSAVERFSHLLTELGWKRSWKGSEGGQTRTRGKILELSFPQL
jgi:hypothetical protein